MKKDLLNEIMNGKKKTKSKPMSGFGNFTSPNLKGMMYKPSSKNNMDNLKDFSMKGMGFPSGKMGNLKSMMSGPSGNLMGDMRPKKNNDMLSNTRSMMPSFKASNIIGDKKTRSQKRYLKKHKGVKRFFDDDGDMVPNALDCFHKNPKKHGFFSKATNLMTKGKFAETEDIKAKKRQKEIDEKRQKLQTEAQELRSDVESKYEAEEKAKKELSEQNRDMAFENKKVRQYEEDYDQAKREWIETANNTPSFDWDEYMQASEPEQEKILQSNPELKKYTEKVRDKKQEYYKARQERIPVAEDWQKKAYMRQKAGDASLESSQKFATESERIARQRRNTEYGDQLTEEEREAERQARKEAEPKAKNIGGFISDQLVKQGFYEPTGQVKDMETERKVMKGTKINPETGQVETRIEPVGSKNLPKGYEWEKTTVKEKTGLKEYEKKPSLWGGVSRKLGYAFESPEKRDISRKADIEQRFQESRTQIKPSELKKIMNNPELTQEEKMKVVTQQADESRRAKQKAEQREREIKPIQKMQDLQQREYARLQIAQSGQNLANISKMQRMQRQQEMKSMFGGLNNFTKSWGFDGSQQLAEGQYKDSRYQLYDSPGYYNLSQYTKNASRVQEPYFPNYPMDNQWVGGDQVRQPNERILPKNRLSGDVSGTLRRNMRSPDITDEDQYRSQMGIASSMASTARYNTEGMSNMMIKKPSTRTYDPDAPKFVYRRDIGSNTRKTTRVKADDDPQLNEESKPSETKRSGSLYPWTKPMRGWKRVYVGKGRYTGKGRQPRSKTYKKYPTSKIIQKPPRQKFVPFKSTYEQKRLDRDKDKQ